MIGGPIPGGLGLLIAPQMALKLLFSNGNYGEVMPRLMGMQMLALGVIVSPLVRSKVEVMYTTALAVRSGMRPIMFGLYRYSGDPLFIALMVIVGIGVVFTGVSYWQDRRDKA